MNVDRSISIRPSNAGNQALNNERLTTNRISEFKNKYLPESNNTESVAINSSNNYSYSEKTETGGFNSSDNNRSDEHTDREENRSSNNNRFRENIWINYSSSDDESGEKDNFERDTTKDTNEKIKNCENLKDVLVLLKTFQRNNVTLNENSYSIIVNEHAKKLKKANKLIKNMKRERIPANEALFTAITKKHNTLKSLKFLKTKAGNPLAGKLIHKVILKESGIDFVKVLRDMRKYQINENHDVNKYIIDQCKTKKDVAKLLKKMNNFQLIPEDNFYDDCFKIDKKESNNSYLWGDELKKEKVSINEKIHSKLLQQCKNNKEKKGYLKWYKRNANENEDQESQNQINTPSMEKYVSDIEEASSPFSDNKNLQVSGLGALAESTKTGGQNADNPLANVIVQSEINNNLANGIQLEEYLNAPNPSQGDQSIEQIESQNQKNAPGVQGNDSDIEEDGSSGKANQKRQEPRLGALAKSTQTGGQNADNPLANMIVQSEINNNLANGIQLEE